MSNTVIKVENLSKQYRLGQIGTGTIRDDFARFWARVRGKEDPTLKIGQTNSLSSNKQLNSSTTQRLNDSTTQLSDYIWALRDINFSVQQGEAIGIIGKNGAGKSTLLKLLSKVTAPTTGNIKIKGRIASLLEVGTGFHPELSGRENIFLNGAIMGMTKDEIRSKFDEIVDFSGVENYIDTPVKRYSSGMYVRLAFAVAAHLEPEILVVDEVLAVGDAEFQKKCLGKMGDVAKGGRTVLFVSHNMSAIQGFCQKAVLLQNGYLTDFNNVNSVINKYLNSGAAIALSKFWDNEKDAPGNDMIRFKSFKIKTLKNEPVITVDTGIAIECVIKSLNQNLNLGFTLYLTNGQGILLFESGVVITDNKDSLVGEYKINVEIPPHLLNSDRYIAKIVIGESQRYVLAAFDDLFSFDVEHTATGRDNNFNKAPGIIRPLLNWKSIFINDTLQ